MVAANNRPLRAKVRGSLRLRLTVAVVLDHIEGILRRQLLSKVVGAATTAAAIIALLFLALHYWTIRPIERLAEIDGKWSARIFSARADSGGASEIRLLANRFNSMAEELEGHEQERTAELERARHIQTNLLPRFLPSLPGLSIAADYRP